MLLFGEVTERNCDWGMSKESVDFSCDLRYSFVRKECLSKWGSLIHFKHYLYNSSLSSLGTVHYYSFLSTHKFMKYLIIQIVCLYSLPDMILSM